MTHELTSARLLFDGKRLTQARQFRRMLKADVAAEVGVTPAAIGQFESGAARPSAPTLGKLSLALGVPVAFFEAGRRAVTLTEDETHFRSLRSTSKRDRAQARTQVERLAEAVFALEERVRLPQASLPTIPVGTSPETAASLIRGEWGLGSGPISSVVGILERHGVIVARLAAATDEVDAFSCWIGDRPFVILASNKGSADRSRFDAAHELGHLILHADAQPGDPDIEREGHRFAAEFLTPEAAILAELPSRIDWRALAELKLRWGVAIAMLVRRARDLGRISDAAYRRAMVEMGRRGWRRDEPASIGAPEQPEMLGRAMALLGTHRGFTMDDLAAELALGREGLEPFADLLAPVAESLALQSRPT